MACSGAGATGLAVVGVGAGAADDEGAADDPAGGTGTPAADAPGVATALAVERGVVAEALIAVGVFVGPTGIDGALGRAMNQDRSKMDTMRPRSAPTGWTRPDSIRAESTRAGEGVTTGNRDEDTGDVVAPDADPSGSGQTGTTGAAIAVPACVAPRSATNTRVRRRGNERIMRPPAG